jgi:hypothetical protein
VLGNRKIIRCQENRRESSVAVLAHQTNGHLPAELTYSMALNRTTNPTRYMNEMKRMCCGLLGSREW